MTSAHPAIRVVLQDPKSVPYADEDRGPTGLEHGTSTSLARALAIGCLSRLDPSLPSVDVWDPAAGLGFAGHILVEALQSCGVQVRYRGQDIDPGAVSASIRRFDSVDGADIAQGDTLAHDAFEGYVADLVIVDAPWGMDWRRSETAVTARHSDGAFGFGLPQRSDSTWLFISLALEKLRPTEQGGGRVAALVNPGALSSGGRTGAVRRRILEAGLLESVTRLPDGLAPNTAIPLYLLTFSNKGSDVGRGEAMIADLQTMFTTYRGRRSVPVEAFRELESGLRTKKPGARNRVVSYSQFTRRDVRVRRSTQDDRSFSWRVTTHKDTAIDSRFLVRRYGADSRISADEEPHETVDLDPGRILGDSSRELLKDMEAKGWPSRRLSSLLANEPEAVKVSSSHDAQLFVPTTQAGRAATVLSETASEGRVLAVQLDDGAIHPDFLAAWLNSEQGIASRRRAIDVSSSGHHLRVLRSDPSSLLRWADELIVPVPSHDLQRDLVSADEQLSSFQAELESHRASIWLFRFRSA